MSDVNFIESSRLAKFLREVEKPSAEWRSSELAAILRHQLAAPLSPDLEHVVPSGPAGPATFFELFSIRNPPVELLSRAKEFAKSRRNAPELGLPAEVATALYFAAIAAALVHLATRISELSDSQLTDGFDWCHKQAWMDESLRALFESAVNPG